MFQKYSIWSLINKNWKLNLLYVLISAIGSSIDIFATYSLGIWIGKIAQYAIDSGNDTLKKSFQNWTIITVVSRVILLIFFLIYSKYKAVLQIKNINLLSWLINHKIISLDYQKYNQRNPGSYLSWFNYDMQEISEGFFGGFYGLIDYCFNIIFIVIALFLNNWIMAVVMMTMFLLINLIPKLISKPLAQINLKTSNIIEKLYGQLGKLLDLWTFLSFKNLRTKFVQKFSHNYAQLRKHSLKKSVINIPYELLVEVLFVVGIGLTFIIAVLLKQAQLIKLDAIAASIALAGRLMSNGLGSASLLLKVNSIKIIYQKVFDQPNSFIGPKQIVHKIPPFSSLILKNVSYQYQDQQDKVIKDFNYQFDRGKKYLIVAPSGYGKSTLVKIMTGLFKDYQGQVLWNGQQELKFINDQLLRQHISYVDNNNYILTDESFQTNITMWSAFNQKRFDQIVQLLNIAELKKNFDQEKNALSEGEKQKIAFARMLYDNRPIIFLDEALDNIDQQYQKRIIKVLQHLASWKTLVMINHNIKPEHQIIFDQVIYLNPLNN